ncbi:MAG TPA: hypothetical protein VFU80_07000 [Sphingomicrobium sp.]|nr:hypothetical protein [Sphingomicrobium sp.]
MRSARALVATNPLDFGRGPAWVFQAAKARGWTLSDEARLFTCTFAAGFLFVSILIA